MPTTPRFLAVILTGLALVAPAAHLAELPNKISLPAEQYFVVQAIYHGWWMLGLLFPLAIIANGAMAWSLRHDRIGFGLAMAAVLLVAADLAIFAVWTQPANAATDNWTLQPGNWEELRRQWEYSHAVNAVVMFAAFCLSTAAALRPPAPPPSVQGAARPSDSSQ